MSVKPARPVRGCAVLQHVNPSRNPFDRRCESPCRINRQRCLHRLRLLHDAQIGRWTRRPIESRRVLDTWRTQASAAMPRRCAAAPRAAAGGSASGYAAAALGGGPPARRGRAAACRRPHTTGTSPVDGSPPRFEMTWPVPRHGAQGSGRPGARSIGDGHRRRHASSGARGRATMRLHRCHGSLRTIADGHAAPRQPAHGAAGVALRALAGRARSSCASTTSTARACGPASPSSSSPTSPRSGWTGTARSCASPSGWSSTRDAIARLDADGLLYPCYCTRAEIREAASAPHGPLPEGAYPGTCRELTAAQRAERERAGRPPALRLRAGGAVVAFTDRLLGARQDAVDDLVVRRNDGAPAYNLAVVVDDAAQGWARSCAARTCSTRPPASCTSPRCWACRPRGTPTCRSSSAPTAPAWPSATAP